jgi:hypothetical protein
VLTDGLTRGRLQIGGWLVAEDRDTPYDGSSKTDNPLQERTRVRVYLLTGDLRISRMFGVQITATVPDVTRSAVVSRPTGVLNYSETFRGLGDTSVITWKRMVAPAGWNVIFNGGLSLPTGKTERPRFSDELEDESLVPVSRLQRGTGTADPVFGVSLNRVVARIFPPGVRVFISGAARVPVAENEFGLRTGASWEVGAGASREVKWHELVVIGRLSWLHRGQDIFEGVPVLVGGGDWFMAAPSVAVTLARSITLQGEVRVPLFRSLDNRQLDSSRSFQLGIVWAIR